MQTTYKKINNKILERAIVFPFQIIFKQNAFPNKLQVKQNNISFFLNSSIPPHLNTSAPILIRFSASTKVTMRSLQRNVFARFLIHPSYEPLRVLTLSATAALIFVMLVSLSHHPASNRTVLSDAEVDALFAECPRAASASPRIAVVLPFRPAQLSLVLAQLEAWKSPARCPCAPRAAAAPRSDLILFLAGDAAQHPHLRARVIGALTARTQRQRDAAQCFGAVRFLSMRDVPLPRRAREADLFYGLLASDALAGYTHALWLDPAAAPLRADWLGALHRAARDGEPFWVLGSLTQARFGRRFERGRYHISLTALYRVGDRCFASFLRRVAAEFGDAPPDLAMHLYRTEYAHFREAQHTQHLFRYSRIFVPIDGGARAEEWPGAFIAAPQ